METAPFSTSEPGQIEGLDQATDESELRQYNHLMGIPEDEYDSDDRAAFSELSGYPNSYN